MTTTNVNIDLYSSGNGKSQKSAGRNGYLNIVDSSMQHLEFTPNVIDIPLPNGATQRAPLGPHVIVFTLTENGLTFFDIEDDHTPGFTWVVRSPEGIMELARSGDEKSITVVNHHYRSEAESNHTCGHWHYQLFARNSAGDIYGIPWTSCNGPGDSNPSIKNR